MTVLIVDDNQESRYLLEILFTGNGYQAQTASNGVEALEILRADKIDVIISDILMPEMDGFQLCREVKTDTSLRAIPFIFYTATYTGPEDEKFALKIGADRFIVKPCEPDVFLQDVEQMLKDADYRKMGEESEQADEKEMLKLYSERLVRKLEQKVVETEEEIRAREEAENALRAKEQRLIEAQRIAKMGDFTWDLDTGAVTWSEGLFELLKYEKSEVFDYNAVNSKIHHPDDLPRITQWLRECIASGSDELTPNEYRVVCKDGEVKYVRTIGVIEREKGRPVRVFATIQDVTAHRQTEEKLHQLKEELERKVAERTAELQEKVQKLDKSQKAMLYMVEDLNHITSELKEERGKLKEVNKELEAFSYSVSHDLRAPLRAIDGFSRIIEEEYAGVLDAEGRRLLSVVRENTQKMDALITDMLELSRTGRTEMRYSEVDMTAMAVSIYHEIASPEVIDTFEFSVTELPRVCADSQLMRRVWSNLISNAIKYSMPKDRRSIHLYGHIENDTCVYSVRDSGVGFDQEYKDKLFTLFQRLHKAEDFQGTGVGLAIVQRIVHRHGGKVWAEGKEGEGAVFSFSIPRKNVDKGGDAE